MKKYSRFFYLAVITALIVAMLPFTRTAKAQTTLPTAAQVAAQIKVGWNIGNTLEAICGETAWGNPMVTQQLINSVKAAGFNAVRIPVSWDCHATNNTIDTAWLARVKQVVDYAIGNGMYVVVNEHWDNGWLENHVTYADQAGVNVKQNAYWTQIANTFKTYDEHLLFAGTNEVHQDYNTPTAENIAVQQSYNQTFVNAVRATGGNNATRTLVVQTYNTNISFGISYFSLPSDSAANRLMVEVHYYDPYDYTLNSANNCIYWGAPYPAQSACSWAQESYMDSTLAQVKTKWINAGVPVMIGEYDVIKRTSLSGQQLTDHLASRLYYFKYFNNSARNNGIKTFFWDTGDVSGVFDRNTGAVTDQAAINAIMQGAGVTVGPTATPSRTSTPTMVAPTATRTRTPTLGASPTTGPTATRTRTPTAGPSLTATQTRTTVVPTRTNTPGSGGTTCSPVSSTITAPFTFDGTGTFCWQSSNLGTYINSWNTTSVTINGTNITNVYMASGSYPAKVGGFWYVTYSSSVAWGHFEAK